MHTLTHETGRQADKAVPQNLRASVHSSRRAVSQPWRTAIPERITSPKVCALNRQRCGTGDLAAQWQGYPGICSFSAEAFVFVAALSTNEDNTGWRRKKWKRPVGLSLPVCAAPVWTGRWRMKSYTSKRMSFQFSDRNETALLKRSPCVFLSLVHPLLVPPPLLYINELLLTTCQRLMSLAWFLLVFSFPSDAGADGLHCVCGECECLGLKAFTVWGFHWLPVSLHRGCVVHVRDTSARVCAS